MKKEQDTVSFSSKLAKAVAASEAHVLMFSCWSPAGTSNKGKSPIMEVVPPVKRRTFRQMEEDRLGEEAAKNLFEEEHADLERQRAEMQRKRQQDVLDSAKYYTDAD
ncbi:hypothetical protein Tco_0710883 [Tanacetum coccineum]